MTFLWTTFDVSADYFGTMFEFKKIRIGSSLANEKSELAHSSKKSEYAKV